MPPRAEPSFRSEVRTGRVEKLVSGGDGLIRDEGLVVFVPGVLAGELVSYHRGPLRKGFARADLIEVLEASPDRRDPPCRLYGRCGGCDFMHLTETAQRRQKQALVIEAFQRLARKTVSPAPPVGGEVWGYRARLQVHKDPASGRVGFKARGSDSVVAVTACPVADPAFSPWWALAANRLPPGRTGAFATGGEVYWEGRDQAVTVSVAGKRLLSSLDGFFQSNLELLPALVAAVLGALPPRGDRVLDLYGGCGLFGAFLADRFTVVVEVEQNAAALALARRNVAGPLHEFHQASLEDWAATQDATRPLDAVVVDPPRTGLSASVSAFLGGLRAGVLVYVSCNPDTLARDTARLELGGWRLDTLELFDFYPQTTHCEAVARFVRA